MFNTEIIKIVTLYNIYSEMSTTMTYCTSSYIYFESKDSKSGMNFLIFFF